MCINYSVQPLLPIIFNWSRNDDDNSHLFLSLTCKLFGWWRLFGLCILNCSIVAIFSLQCKMLHLEEKTGIFMGLYSICVLSLPEAGSPRSTANLSRSSWWCSRVGMPDGRHCSAIRFGDLLGIWYSPISTLAAGLKGAFLEAPAASNDGREQRNPYHSLRWVWGAGLPRSKLVSVRVMLFSSAAYCTLVR